MAKVPFYLIFFCSSLACMAQSAETLKQEADKYYNEEQYNLAIPYYRELSNLSELDSAVNYQLAESYRKTFNYREAEVYYLKVYYQAPLQFPMALYYYALMLKLNGNFDESIHMFSEFIYASQNNVALNGYVEQATVDRAGSEMAKAEQSKKQRVYSIQSESVNSVFNDYAPSLRDSNTMVITSGRLGSNRDVIDERYGEGYTNNYYFVKDENAWQDKTRQLFSVTNTRYNDGSGCFNSKGDKYYFTVCGKDGPQCRIYLTTFKKNKWTEPILLNDNINIKGYEAKHPGISKGGDTLLFSSNRPGGFGSYDIWMSVNAGQDNWGPAMNMGGTINTKLNELAPAFAGFSHLFFFTSDGHQNYGGLDLYMAKRFSNGNYAIFNLDYPFNSNRDDCFISFARKKIYFSSNREDGKGGFDIYSVTIPSAISFVSRLGLKNKDARGDVKLNARLEKVTSLDLIATRNEDQIEYENLTYDKRKIIDKMVYNKAHNIQEKKDDYAGLTKSEYENLLRIAEVKFKTEEMERRFAKTFLTKLTLPPGSKNELTITGILLDSLTGQPLPLRKILLMDANGEVLKITTSNEKGMFRFTSVSNNNHFYLRLQEVLSEGEKPVVDAVRYRGSDEELTSRFENIYFDFDHYSLRPEAKQVLNELATYLKQTPSVQVEMYAYADDLGTDDYNMTLTRKRGEAVLNYLTSQGVDQTALAVIAKGKLRDQETLIEVKRQYNRRVEFYLNGAKEPRDKSIQTHILKKKSNWKTIAELTGIPVDTLKSLNGASSDDLQMYQPIRIPNNSRGIPEEMFFTIY